MISKRKSFFRDSITKKKVLKFSQNILQKNIKNNNNNNNSNNNSNTYTIYLSDLLKTVFLDKLSVHFFH